MRRNWPAVSSAAARHKGVRRLFDDDGRIKAASRPRLCQTNLLWVQAEYCANTSWMRGFQLLDKADFDTLIALTLATDTQYFDPADFGKITNVSTTTRL